MRKSSRVVDSSPTPALNFSSSRLFSSVLLMRLSISLCLRHPLFFLPRSFLPAIHYLSSSPSHSHSIFFVLIAATDPPRSPVSCSTLQHFARSSSCFISSSRSLSALSARTARVCHFEKAVSLTVKAGLLRTRDTCNDSPFVGNSLPRFQISRVIDIHIFKSFRRAASINDCRHIGLFS